jgi:hypothetical protein
MSTFLTVMLVAHVVLGLAGCIGFYALWLNLLARGTSRRQLLQRSTVALTGILLSWLTGGYYYVKYYGASVKPGLVEGATPWAHTIFTEAKEHVFLFLPFLALTLLLASWAASPEQLADKPRKQPLLLLAGVSSLIGIVVTVSGVIISGAVR